MLTYGYNAEVFSRTKTVANISDFANGLLAAIKYKKGEDMEDIGIGKVGSALSGFRRHTLMQSHRYRSYLWLIR